MAEDKKDCDDKLPVTIHSSLEGIAQDIELKHIPRLSKDQGYCRIHGIDNAYRLAGLVLTFVKYLEDHPEILSDKERQELEKLKNNPDDLKMMLIVALMRSSGRWNKNHTRWTDGGSGTLFALEGARRCYDYLINELGVEDNKAKEMAYHIAGIDYDRIDHESSSNPNPIEQWEESLCEGIKGSLFSKILGTAAAVETVRDTIPKSMKEEWLPLCPRQNSPHQKARDDFISIVTRHENLIDKMQGYRLNSFFPSDPGHPKSTVSSRKQSPPKGSLEHQIQTNDGLTLQSTFNYSGSRNLDHR